MLPMLIQNWCASMLMARSLTTPRATSSRMYGAVHELRRCTLKRSNVLTLQKIPDAVQISCGESSAGSTVSLMACYLASFASMQTQGLGRVHLHYRLPQR